MRLRARLALGFLALHGGHLAAARWYDGLHGVKVLTPQDDYAQVAKAIHEQMVNAQFSPDRYAVILTPGEYPELKLSIGYYTSVIGVADVPSKVRIKRVFSLNGLKGGATQNFWRSVEGVTLTDSFNVWAVSQGAPMRRCIAEGDIYLSDNGGWSSGGFMADVAVHGIMDMGTQQQFFFRNMDFGKQGVSCPIGWNYVFVGVNGLDASKCQGKVPGKVAALDETPRIAEKPYIVLEEDGETWNIYVPAMRRAGEGQRIRGSSAEQGSPMIARKLNIETEVFVARPEHTTEDIQKGIQGKKGLLLTPWVFVLTDAIQVNTSGFVVLGIGYATLVSVAGKTALQVADGVEDVRIAGILLEAGTPGQGVGVDPALLRWGSPHREKKLPGKRSNSPGVMSDVFARVGAFKYRDCMIVSVDSMVEINSDNVVVDNLWLWHADHDDCGRKSDSCFSSHCFVVNGDNVTAYGVSAEHAVGGDIAAWNGEEGEMYFYQCELPYHSPEFRKGGYAGYALAPDVKSHVARGMGVYIIGDMDVKTAYRTTPTMLAENLVTVVIGDSPLQFKHTACVRNGGSGTEEHCLPAEQCDRMRCVLAAADYSKTDRLANQGMVMNELAGMTTDYKLSTTKKLLQIPVPATTAAPTTIHPALTTVSIATTPTSTSSPHTLNCELEVKTSKQVLADTTLAGVEYSAHSNGKWGPDQVLAQQVSLGEALHAKFTAPGIPEKIRLKAQGSDAFGYKRIRLICEGQERMLLDSVNGDLYGANRYWVDATGGGLAPVQQVYDVPDQPPAWRIYAHYDYPDKDDAEHMDASNLEAVRERVMEKGYAGFSLNLGMAFLKSTDRLLSKKDLRFMGDASPVAFYLVIRPEKPITPKNNQSAANAWARAAEQSRIIPASTAGAAVEDKDLSALIFGDAKSAGGALDDAGMAAAHGTQLTKLPPPGDAVPAIRNVRITVVALSGLHDGDWLGDADPYCAVFATDDEQREIYAFRTQTMHNTKKPEWHFQKTYDMKQGNGLEFVVMDQDVWSSRELGRAKLPGEKIFPSGFVGDLELPGGGSGKLRVKVEMLIDQEGAGSGGLIEKNALPMHRRAMFLSGALTSMNGVAAIGCAALLASALLALASRHGSRLRASTEGRALNVSSQSLNVGRQSWEPLVEEGRE